MIPAQFDYEAPRTLGEALALLGSRPDAKLLAGGHSLLPAMKLRVAYPGTLVDLGRIAGLDQIRRTADGVVIGAMATHAAIAASDVLRAVSPLLAECATCIGDMQVRNRGTLGGSLAQAHPAADYPAAILALDAEMVAISPAGERTIAAGDFFRDLFTSALAANEILTEIRIPATNGAGVSYKKFHHPASGFAVVGVAAVVSMKGEKIENAALGVTGVGHTAYRARKVEAALRGKTSAAIADAAKHAAEGIEALADTFASADYRRHVAAVYARRALEEAIARARPK